MGSMPLVFELRTAKFVPRPGCTEKASVHLDLSGSATYPEENV